MTKTIKRAAPIVEATLVSVAVVLAAVAIPAVIMYASV